MSSPPCTSVCWGRKTAPDDCQPWVTCPGRGGDDYLEEIQKEGSVEEVPELGLEGCVGAHQRFKARSRVSRGWKKGPGPWGSMGRG